MNHVLTENNTTGAHRKTDGGSCKVTTAMPKKVVTNETLFPVVVVAYSGKFGVQIPQTLQSSGWIASAPITVGKSGKTLSIKLGGEETIKQMGKTNYAPIALELADRLGWDKGDVLLMKVDGDKITIKVPEALDFCLESLYESWLFTRLAKGQGTVIALSELGGDVGKVFTPHTLARWRSGGVPPPDAINIMISEVMGVALSGGGVLNKADLKIIQRGISLVV